MIGSTNIRPIAEVIAPAVCRMIAPRPKAISATTVTNSAVPMIAASTVAGVITSVPTNVAVRRARSPGRLRARSRWRSPGS